MKILDIFKKKIKLKMPVTAGRISVESFKTYFDRYQQEYNFLDPEIPGYIIEAIEKFAIINPDFSQHVKNIINLGNTGHTLEIVADDEETVRKAESRINDLARTIYPYGGADGLVNKMLSDIAVFGAPSIEAVINPDLKGVKKIVIVPHHQIVFKYDPLEDEYLPYQKAGVSERDYIPLNPLTYYYAPLYQKRNSPYAIPPLISALEPLINQLFIKENLRFLVKKMGLLGLIHAILSSPPRKPTETEEQYLSRLKNYLNEVAENISENYRDGVMVTYDEFELKHFNIATNAGGVQGIFQINEEQLASGMGTDPAMLGRTYSTTETYAGVVFAKLLKEIANYQRIVRRGLEKIYLLDLYLSGIPVKDVNIKFNSGVSLRPKEDAEIENIKSQKIINEYLNGVITLDEARSFLGYPPLEQK
jgi:hypothetical protein